MVAVTLAKTITTDVWVGDVIRRSGRVRIDSDHFVGKRFAQVVDVQFDLERTKEHVFQFDVLGEHTQDMITRVVVHFGKFLGERRHVTDHITWGGNSFDASNSEQACLRRFRFANHVLEHQPQLLPNVFLGTEPASLDRESFHPLQPFDPVA